MHIEGWKIHPLITESFSSCFLPPTPGSKNTEEGQVLKQLFHQPHFRVTVVSDVSTVELCGALKVCVHERERERGGGGGREG